MPDKQENLKTVYERVDNIETYKTTIKEKRGFSLARGKEDPNEIIDKEVLHNENGPAHTFYFNSNLKKYEAYFLEGKRNRTDGPSTIEYHPDGKIKDEQWYKNDTIHRDNNLPAWKEWDENGVLRVERYMVNGLYHRTDGPAYITYDENGQIKEQINYRNGEIV